MFTSEDTRAILRAYGYSTRTLAIDLEVTPSVARRILHGKNDLWSKDIIIIVDRIVEYARDLIIGRFKPGELKTVRESWAYINAKRLEAKKKVEAERIAGIKRRQELRQRMTPQEKCADDAETLTLLIEGCEDDGYTLDDLFEEIKRQRVTGNIDAAS